MEANRARQLLTALSALLVAEPEQAEKLVGLLPEYVLANRPYLYEFFDGDWLYLFCACLEDFYADWGEQILENYPKSEDFLDELPCILAMQEPRLYLNEPEQWADFRRQLADLVTKLEAVV